MLLQSIRTSCAFVTSRASQVHIVESAIDTLLDNEEAFSKDFTTALKNVEWDSPNWHYSVDVQTAGPLTAQYILVLDALNFCFWPVKNLEYEHLAVGLKNALLADSHAFDAQKLASVDEDEVKRWFGGWEVPLLDERVRRVQEVGAALSEDFDGLVANLVVRADHSAGKLVSLVTGHFPGFRDTTVYQGHLIHLYKRAQIFVADLWGAYGRPTDPSHPYYFHDIEQLTMFADYRIPQILRHTGVLTYSQVLQTKIDNFEVIPFGSAEETEIRACTIIAVEMLRDRIRDKCGYQLTSVEVDWLLWNWGEKVKDSIAPHHRTLTIYY